MSLNKRFLRNIKSNLSFYICIILLTAIVTCMYLCLNVSYKEEVRYIDDIRGEVNLEDGQFTTYLTMSEKDIEEVQNTCGVTIETMKYVDLEGEAGAGSAADSIVVRVFAPTQTVDRYVVTEGEDIQSERDILLSPLFAERNGYQIGDEITLTGGEARTYHVSGYCVKLDYMFCLKNFTDTFSNTDGFGVGILSGEAFAQLPGEDVVQYNAIRYDDADERTVRETLYEKFHTSSYVARENNNRITTPDDQLAELGATIQLILPMAVAFIVILMAVVLGRKVKNEQKMLGVLNALGYRRRELALHYSVFGVICGVVGGILGVILSFPLLEPMAEIAYESKLEPLPIHLQVPWTDALYAVLFPTIAYLIAVFFTAVVIMRGSTIGMIRGVTGKKTKHAMRMAGSRMNFRAKYRIRAIFGNLPRTLIVLIGIGIGGALLSFGYACVDSLVYYCDTAVRETGAFEYEYFLNALHTEPLEHGTKALSASFAVEDYADMVTLMGLENKDYLTVETVDGKDIELEDGKFYISEMGSYIYGVKEGDILTVYDVTSMREFDVEIDGVFHNGNQCLIVSNIGTVAKLAGIPGSVYNVVMSDTPLDYKESQLIKEIRKTDIEDSLRNNILKSMQEVMGIIIGFGMLICVIVVFLMVNVLLTESAASISMLKVLGYRDREVNKIVTHIYHFLLPLGAVLGLVMGYWLNKYNFIASTEVYNTFVEAHMSILSMVKCLAITILSYIVALLLLGRKVERVSMVESLKNNRE